MLEWHILLYMCFTMTLILYTVRRIFALNHVTWYSELLAVLPIILGTTGPFGSNTAGGGEQVCSFKNKQLELELEVIARVERIRAAIACSTCLQMKHMRLPDLLVIPAARRYCPLPVHLHRITSSPMKPSSERLTIVVVDDDYQHRRQLSY